MKNIERRQVFAHIPYPYFRREADRILERGLQPELYFSAGDLENFDGREGVLLADRLRGAGLDCTIHAPFLDLNPGAVDRDVRLLTLSRYLAVLEPAAVFRPRALVYHPGYDRWRYDGDVDRWLEECVRTFDELLREAERLSPGAKILVENIFETGPESLERLFRALGHPALGFCFDTGHFAVFSETGLDEWMESLGPRLEEIHLHDNDGKRDAHLPPGRGCFPFEKLFENLEAIRKTGVLLTFESHSEEDLNLSLAYLAGRFSLEDMNPGSG